LEVRLHQECRVVALPEVWSHVRWIDHGTKPSTREQYIGFLHNRLTVMGRSIRPDRLTPALAIALEQDRLLNAQELARLEATPG
jgi:hypothetical protein